MLTFKPDAPPEDDPFVWFRDWLEEAEDAKLVNPNAMTLATVDADGAPDARTVLLKAFDPGGFVFFTNLRSAKGRQLAANPNAALCFYWRPLERQVRVRGHVEAVDAVDADAYFASRPRGSQLGAWASEQSTPLVSRGALLARVVDFMADFGADPVPRPPHWSGYRLVPTSIEFWVGRPDRLHDRWAFTRQEDGAWKATRLAP